MQYTIIAWINNVTTSQNGHPGLVMPDRVTSAKHTFTVASSRSARCDTPVLPHPLHRSPVIHLDVVLEDHPRKVGRCLPLKALDLLLIK